MFTTIQQPQRTSGYPIALYALLIVTLNTACNLEQFLQKKATTSSATVTDNSLTWTAGPILYPTAGVHLKSKVFGSINRPTASVKLYAGSGCATLIATGTATEAEAGLQFATAASTTTDIYAKIVDATTNSESNCQYIGQYLTVSPTVNALYATNGANWNDYVINNGSSIFNATGAACTGAETNGYMSCLHGAEMKKVVVTGADSCTGLSISDNLGAFIWTCQVVSGQATFYSVALKPFKGLKDLITGTTWRNMSVTVVSSAGSTNSPTTSWWSNTITALPDNATPSSGVVSLSTSGTIYTLASSRATEGYALTAPKVALVTLSGALLTYTSGASNFVSATGLTTGVPNIKAMIGMGSQSYLWIEADLNGAAAGGQLVDATVLVRNTKHLRIKNSNFKNSAVKFLNFNGVTKSAILDTKLTNSAGAAIEIDNSSDIIAARVHISNADQGLYAYLSPTVYVSELTSINVNAYSLEFDGSNLGTATAVSAINSNYVGIDFWDSSNATVHNALAINVASQAVGGGSSTAITANTWSQLAIGNSPLALGVSNSTSSKVTGNIVFAGNTANCSASNSGSGFTNACANAGLGSATFLEKASASFGSSIVGKVTSDVQNASDTNGTGTYPAAMSLSAFDFLSFTSWFRSWGRNGSVFPNTDNRGRMSNANTAGRIWDSRPYTNDTHIFDRTHSLSSANAAITADAACPAQLRGDIFLTDQQSRKYLKNAIEFVGDNLGNENGLCENNEACVYTPNFGGYQGEGALFSNTCTFSDNGDPTGNVTGVTIFFYPTNGVPVTI